jgi:hypothetical protein
MTDGVALQVRWKGSATLIALASIALVAVAWSAPQDRDRAAQAFVVFAGALVIRLLVRAVVVATSGPRPLAFDRALVPRSERVVAWATEPERIEYEVGAATHRAMELHHQFRRRLRALADDRLTADHGVSLDRDQVAARKLLGEQAWDLLRPDREPPEDRFGPGLPVADVTAIVTAVEDL